MDIIQKIKSILGKRDDAPKQLVAINRCMFPSHWTPEQVMQKIIEGTKTGYNSQYIQQKYLIFKGITEDGLKMRYVIELQPDGNTIKNAYPLINEMGNS